jgi:hypothetical protein
MTTATRCYRCAGTLYVDDDQTVRCLSCARSQDPPRAWEDPRAKTPAPAVPVLPGRRRRRRKHQELLAATSDLTGPTMPPSVTRPHVHVGAPGSVTSGPGSAASLSTGRILSLPELGSFSNDGGLE